MFYAHLPRQSRPTTGWPWWTWVVIALVVLAVIGLIVGRSRRSVDTR
jgi:hypothetical protein